MDSSPSPITPFEREFLRRFLSSVPEFYLTGGSALALWLGHRRSMDLDLFTADDVAFRAAGATLPVIATSIRARVEILRDYPAFRRVLLTASEGETSRVDLVLDTAERAGPPPTEVEGLRCDPPEEITANKVCAILGRSETRDLVDLFFLDRAGHRVLDALPAAKRKDPGLTAGLLAWAIAQVQLDRLPDGLLVSISVEELQVFRMRLVEALERQSFPER